MSTASGARQVSQLGLLALTWAGVGIAGFFVAVRCMLRLRLAAKISDIGADDYWIVAAFVFLVANGVLQTLQSPHLYYMIDAAQGLASTGQALAYHGVEYAKYEFAIIGIFYTVLWCVKASFLAMYYRLFQGLKVWRRCWWCVVAFTFLSYIACWIASTTTCHPVSAYFEFGQCIKPIDQWAAKVSIITSTALDVLIDVLIIILPTSLIWNLKVTRRTKAGLVLVFSLGILIVAVAILRAVEINGKSYSDPVWLALWGIVESSVSVVVGCLPPLKTLMKFERAGESMERDGPRQKEEQHWRSHFLTLENKSEVFSFTLKDNIGSDITALGHLPRAKTPQNVDDRFVMSSVLLTEGSDTS